jgi:hypothetical protein
MSKAKDPKDVAIAYVMHAPLAEAVTFAQTLAAVVKARAAAPPAVITDPNAPPLLEQAAAEVAASTS